MQLFPLPFRFRSESDFKVIDFVWSDLNGTNTIPSSAAYINGLSYNSMWAKYETLLDYPRVKHLSVPQDSRVRPVQHVKITTSGRSPVVPFQGGIGVVTPISRSSIINPIHLLDVVVPPVSEPVWRTCWRESFNSFSDQFPEDVGLANFLIEARDLTAIIPKIEKTISKTLASGFLNYEFNIKPTIKDLTALGNLCTSMSSRIEYLKNTKNKPTRLRYGKFIPPPLLTPVFIDQGDGGTKIEYSFKSFKVKYNSSATLLQDLTHLDDFYGLLRAFVGKTGLNNPLKIVWNALPFSFIVDWFANVSSYLDSAKVQAADSRWNIYDVTATMKQTVELEAFQIDRLTGSRLTKLGDIRFERYERILGLPVSLVELPSIEALNPKQLALMLAMLA